MSLQIGDSVLCLSMVWHFFKNLAIIKIYHQPAQVTEVAGFGQGIQKSTSVCWSPAHMHSIRSHLLPLIIFLFSFESK